MRVKGLGFRGSGHEGSKRLLKHDSEGGGGEVCPVSRLGLQG